MFTLSCSNTGSRPESFTPSDYAQKVADIIVDGTQFEFKPALQEFEQDGVYIFDFPVHDPGFYIARSKLKVESLNEYDFGIEFAISHPAGAIEIKLNGKTIYEANTKESGRFNYVDYGLFEYQSKKPIELEDGDFTFIIKFSPSEPGEDRIYVNFVRDDNALSHPAVGLEAPSEEEDLKHYGFWWIGPLDEKSIGEYDVMTPEMSESDLIEMEIETNSGKRVRWDLPKLHLVKALPGWLTYQNWHYSGGTFLDAMLEVSKHFDGLNYQNYIEEHMNFLSSHVEEIGEMREDYGLIESPFGHYFRFSLLDDMGMQTVPFVNKMLDSGEVDENAFSYKLANRVVNHIMNEASRLEDGTYARFTPDTMSVWADDLYMSSIVLLKMYDLNGNSAYLEQVIFQVLSFDQYLRDSESNVYWHGYFSRNREFSSTKWGRANGWTIMAKVELLKRMESTHPKYAEVLEVFSRHCKGLLALQSADGRWHQVLDDPSSYLETSATAMFVRGFAEGVARGWLERELYEESAELGWSSLTEQFDSEGNVTGIVRGTPIMFSDQEYDDWGTRINDPRGLGALLYASIAIDLMRTSSN
jgi:rhamnogalacturonyl hydrolase YesR